MAAKRLGGTVTTIDDVEHPLDRGEINDVRIAGFGLDPRPQRLARHGTRRSPKRTHIGRIKRRSRGLNDNQRIGDKIGMPVQDRHNITTEAGRHLGQQTVPNRCSMSGDVVVGLVFTRRDSGGTTHRHRVASRQAEDGTQHIRHACRCTSQPCAAEQVEQHRLRSVVGRVGHAHVIREGGITLCSGNGLEVGRWLHVEMPQFEGHAPLTSKPFDEGSVIVGRIPHSVMHMPDRHRLPGRSGKHRHRNTVGATAHAEMQVTVREPATLE